MFVRLASLAALLACVPVAAPLALERSQLEVCARLTNDAERLACFDRLVPRPAEVDPAQQSVRANSVPVPSAPLTDSPLGDRWAIGLTSGETLFDVRPHKPTYILPARYTDRVNQTPKSPSQPVANFGDLLNATEAKFQISFKFKLADMTESLGASLWAGYTQQSQWQVYNDQISRPFRETNYEPELMLAWHPDREWRGWRWRLFNVGVVHQSNGRADPLSRSWNRLYAEFGVERGNFMMLLRPWYRFKEDAGEDNNPDITEFLGRGDLVLAWRKGNHVLSSTARLNLSSGKGSIHATWGFPLFRRVNGYVQVISGYGESMIDYNHYQNTFGLGLSLADWL